jgi:hypothetical protein
MTDLESRIFLVAYTVSNLVAIFMLFAAMKWPRIARALFFLLFAWASLANWRISTESPNLYLQYADSAFLDIYKQFINGWFASHIQITVGFIATCQGLIALCMFTKGSLFKIGCTGGIVFLISILPLGFYAAFPCTLIMAIAMFMMLRKQKSFMWTYQFL